MADQRRGAALVTGAGKRIGRAMALALGEAGYDVAVHYHAAEKDAEKVAAAIREQNRNALAIKCDFSQEQRVSQLIGTAKDALGPLSLLVNSASVFEYDDIASATRESWDRHLEVNLRAPFKLAQDFAAQAPDSADNLIVNILDQRVLKPTPQFLTYALSKSALHAFTTTLAQALGPRGVRVNAIGPGPTLKNPRQSEGDWRRQNEATVLGRGALPDDIVQALFYLISARAVTGQMIAVDGGQHLAWRTPDVLVKE